jgi:hypothetical protein
MRTVDQLHGEAAAYTQGATVRELTQEPGPDSLSGTSGHLNSI